VAAAFRAAAAEDGLPADEVAAIPAARRVFLPLVYGSAGDTPPAEVLPALQLTVDRDGVYRVTYEQLRGAGFDLAGVAAERIALLNQGQPVQLWLSTVGGFGPGAYLEFFGQAVDTRYTRTNVYYLVLDKAQARRTAVIGAAPGGAAVVPYYLETVEVDRNRDYESMAPQDDPWFDTGMLAYQEPKSWDFSLAVTELAAGEPARLTVNTYGVTNWPLGGPDHHLMVALNDRQLADRRFDGIRPLELSAELPDGTLREGENTLRLTLPGDSGFDWDVVNLDRYAVTYPRAFVAREGALSFEAAGGAFEVTGLPSADVVVYRQTATGAARLEGVAVTADGASYRARFAGTAEPARYWLASAGALGTAGIAPARPRADITSGKADYLVIAHPSFIEGIQRLVDYHAGRNLAVKVVDARDVYDQYGGGVFGAAAIRDYIRAVKEPMGLRHVLLVGGDTYDYLDYLGKGSMSFIPTPYTDTGLGVRHAPVDTLYADVDGDRVPDLSLGRLPVRTEAELASVVAKTLAYADKGYGRTAVFAADKKDDISRFADDSTKFIAGLPAGWRVERADVDDGVDVAREKLLSRLNEGVALTSYVGHSSALDWTFDGLFKAADARSLANAGRPTVVLQWGCWNTYYVAPSYNTLAHTFLLSGDRGAAAVLGASTLTQAASDVVLGQLVFPRAVTAGKSLGEAVLEAKAELARTNPEMTDVLLGWTLLGDPALVVEH
jgi:hypothetical protein